MPREGYVSISIPREVKKLLDSLCTRYGLSTPRCILFLIEFYRSVVHDPGLNDVYRKKIERALRRAKRKYNEILAEMKAIEEEEVDPGDLL